MSINNLFLGAFILVTNLQVSAQKLKYEDIFYLLEAKEYEKAEPFLKLFLKDSKNEDHPNGVFQMGKVFDSKAMKADVFTELNNLQAFKDSAFLYYDRAKILITEKEVKKNDEFYNDFKRIDVRTGKSDVKPFDIFSLIDERKKELADRLDGANQSNQLNKSANKLFEETQQQFTTFVNEHKTEKELLLRSNLKSISSLDEIILSYASFEDVFEKYKEELRKTPKSGYGPKLFPQEIKDFKKDGHGVIDLLGNDIQVWNYGSWAKTIKNKITSEILPLKSKIEAYDAELETLLGTVLKDSSEFTDELQKLKSNFSNSDLLKYDSNPLPLKIFDLRFAELGYLNSFFKNKDIRDSLNFPLRYNILENEISLLKALDSTVSDIAELDIDAHIRNYKSFVDNRYDGYLGLDKFLKMKLKFADESLNKYSSELEGVMFRNSFILAKGDTILIDTSDVSKNVGTSIPRIVNESYALGIDTTGTKPKGYFIEITPSRTTNTYYKFDIDIPSLEGIKILESPDPSGQVIYALFYNFSARSNEETDDSHFNLFLTKVYVVDGVNWSKSYQLDKKPSSVEILPEGGINIIHETGSLILDKEGVPLNTED